MEIGVDSFVAATVDADGRTVEPARHLSELLEAITLAVWKPPLLVQE